MRAGEVHRMVWSMSGLVTGRWWFFGGGDS